MDEAELHNKAVDMLHKSMKCALSRETGLPSRVYAQLRRNGYKDDGHPTGLNIDKIHKDVKSGAIWGVSNIGKTSVQAICMMLVRMGFES